MRLIPDATVRRIASEMGLTVRFPVGGVGKRVFVKPSGYRFSAGCDVADLVSGETAEDQLRRQLTYQASREP